jgi:putative oxidoreductase
MSKLPIPKPTTEAIPLANIATTFTTILKVRASSFVRGVNMLPDSSLSTFPNTMTPKRILASTAPKVTILIRILVGAVFLSEGIQKFLFPEALGVGRFTKIGIPAPAFTAPFVGTVEIIFGLLIIAGLLTRLSAIPLLIDIVVAIGTTKIPMLIEKGFWAAAHEARTDFAMLMGLIFLLIMGAGPISIDAKLAEQASNS